MFVLRQVAEQELKVQSKQDELRKLEAQLKLDAASVEALKLENELLKGDLDKQQQQQKQLKASIQREARPLKQMEEKVSRSFFNFFFYDPNSFSLQTTIT